MHKTNILKPALSSSMLICVGLSVTLCEGGNAPEKIIYNNNIIVGPRYYLHSTAFNLLAKSIPVYTLTSMYVILWWITLVKGWEVGSVPF